MNSLEQTFGNFTQGLQKGWEDIQRNNPIYNGISNITGAFGHPLPQTPIISPLTVGQELTPGLIYKTKQDQYLVNQATNNVAPPFTPKTLEYPAWMANAPTQPSALDQAKAQLSTRKSPSQNQVIPRITPAPQTLVHPDFANFVNEQLLPLTRKYGIPDAVAAAQAAHESGYGSSMAGNNNYFGLKAHSYAGFANFDSLEAAVKYYAETLAALAGNNLETFKNNPMGLINAIQSGTSHYEGNNPDPMQYIYDTTNNPYWQAYGGGQPMTENPNGWLGAKPKKIVKAQ